jgi:hypothetical protein
MLEGTPLHNTCVVKNTAEEMIEGIHQCFQTEFLDEDVEKRKEALVIFDNDQKTRQLIGYVFGGKKRTSNFFS